MTATSRPDRPWARWAAVAMAMVIASASVAAAPHPPASPEACVEPVAMSLPEGPIVTTLEFECVNLEAGEHPAITIAANGRLYLNTTHLGLTAPVTITVESGGLVHLQDATITSADPAMAPSAWRLVAEPGSTVHMDRVRMAGSKEVIVRTSEFLARDVAVHPFHGVGLRVESSGINLERVLLAEGPAGLVLRAGSAVTADDLTLRDLSVAGIDAQGSALVATDIHMERVGNALLLAGASAVRLDRFGHTQMQPKAHLGLGGPLLEIFAAEPPWSPGDTVFADDASTLRLGWLPFIQVVEDDADGLHPSAGAGVQVEVRTTPDAQPVSALTTNQDGFAGPVRVVEHVFNKTLLRTEPDPYLFLRLQHNVNTTQVPLAEAKLWKVLLPLEADDEPPLWTVTEPVTAPAWTSDGVARLAWTPATDGPKPNRVVSHYEVYRMPAAGDPAHVGAAFGTKFEDPMGSPGPILYGVRPVDLAGNVGPFSNLVTVRLDPHPPALSIAASGEVGPNATWFRGASVLLEVAATDEHSGIKDLAVRLPGQVAFVPSEASYVVSQEGLHRFTFRARDHAGHEKLQQVDIGLDRGLPEFSFGFEPPFPDGNGGWYKSPVQLHVDATDAVSGVHATSFRLGTNDWTFFNHNVTLSQAGSHILTVNVTDKAGNHRLAQRKVSLDTDLPILKVTPTGAPGEAGWYRGPVTFKVEAYDNTSGIHETSFRASNEAWSRVSDNVAFDQEQDRAIQFRAVDVAGNVRETALMNLRIDREPPIPPIIEILPPEGPGGNYRIDWSKAPPFDAMSGVARTEIYRILGDAEPERVATAQETARSAIVPIQPGTPNAFFARVHDVAGWSADSDVVRISVAEGSGLALNLPPGPFSLRGTHTFEAHPPDPETVVSVAFFVDGVLQEAYGRAPYAWTADAATLGDGTHELLILVTRSDGTTTEERHLIQVRSGYVAAVEPFLAQLGVLLVIVLIGLGVAVAGHFKLRRLSLREPIVNAAGQPQGAPPNLWPRRALLYLLALNLVAMLVVGLALPQTMPSAPSWAFPALIASAAVVTLAELPVLRLRAEPVPESELLARDSQATQP